MGEEILRLWYNSVHDERAVGIYKGNCNKWIIKADFIVKKDGEYRQLEFDRRRRFAIEDVPVWAVSPEDLILS